MAKQQRQQRQKIKKPAPQCSPYKKLLDNTETLCKSQVYSEVYNKLKKENKLSRFIAIVQYCSTEGYDLQNTVNFILKSLPGYLTSEEFDIDAFKYMINAHSDISEAWGYGLTGDKITDIQIKNKAVQLVLSTDQLEDIQAYLNMFGSINNNTDESGSKQTNQTLNRIFIEASRFGGINNIEISTEEDDG